jgi:hypothetical protein
MTAMMSAMTAMVRVFTRTSFVLVGAPGRRPTSLHYRDATGRDALKPAGERTSSVEFLHGRVTQSTRTP